MGVGGLCDGQFDAFWGEWVLTDTDIQPGVSGRGIEQDPTRKHPPFVVGCHDKGLIWLHRVESGYLSSSIHRKQAQVDSFVML
jgi:hypothetical protein